MGINLTSLWKLVIVWGYIYVEQTGFAHVWSDIQVKTYINIDQCNKTNDISLHFPKEGAWWTFQYFV